jgi:UDP-N-acetyl-2-amino-2-deoxyglucuronate dehydrogenase
MERYNVGIIGCGGIAQIHRQALAACEAVRVSAVCDVVAERAQAMAQTIMREDANNGPVQVYTDWHAMVASGEVESVHLCTPHWLHAPMAIEAMQAGCHVLTEKPMAITESDARNMIRVSGQTGRRLGVCFQNRYNSTSTAMREALASGRTGKVTGGRAFVTWKRDRDYYMSGSWRGSWKEEGGGVMINQAIHTLDLLQWMLGTPETVRGTWHTRQLGDVIEVEDTAEAFIRFADGVNGLFYATNAYCSDAPVMVEVVCEHAVMRLDGGLTIQYGDGETVTVGEQDTATGEKAYWGCGHKALILDWYDRMRTNEPFPLDGSAGLPALRLVLGLYQSGTTGREVRLQD